MVLMLCFNLADNWIYISAAVEALANLVYEESHKWFQKLPGSVLVSNLVICNNIDSLQINPFVLRFPLIN